MRSEPRANPVDTAPERSDSLRKANYAPHLDGIGYLAGYYRGDDPKQTGRVNAVMPQAASKINTQCLGIM